jgi:murein DD-endopeptidase MepM/ murein hydrolase activator NlpD
MPSISLKIIIWAMILTVSAVKIPTLVIRFMRGWRRVLLARDGGPGWGKVIIVLHAIEENGTRRYVQSCYGHCQEILVYAGDEVHRGQKIANVGTGDGQYFAHLHFEMREFITPFIGPGYRRIRPAG